MLMNSAFRDLWVPGLCFCLLFATMIAGLIQLFTGRSPGTCVHLVLTPSHSIVVANSHSCESCPSHTYTPYTYSLYTLAAANSHSFDTSPLPDS